MAITRKGAREFTLILLAALKQANLQPREDIDEAGLARKIDNLIVQEGKTRHTLDETQTFCCVIGDNNPIHRSKIYAARMNFDDTLAPGTLLSARAETLWNRICEILGEEVGISPKLVRQKTTFKNPVLHGTQVEWIPSATHRNGSVLINFSGQTRGEEKFVVDLELGKSLRENSTRPMYGPISTGKYVINPEQLAAFCQSLGTAPEERIPLGYVASFVTSLLLEKSKEADGMPTGINRATNYSFHKPAELGDVAVDLYLKRKPKAGGEGYVYKFDTVCSQKHDAIVTGNITVLSQKELKAFD